MILVEIVDGLENLLDDRGSFSLLKSNSLSLYDLFMECVPCAQLHHDVDEFFRFKVLVDLNDVGMIKSLEQFDLVIESFMVLCLNLRLVDYLKATLTSIFDSLEFSYFAEAAHSDNLSYIVVILQVVDFPLHGESVFII